MPRLRSALLLVLALSGFAVHAQLKLPSFFSDSMVLQRNMKVPVWGWAAAGETVKVNFNGKEYTATAQQDGKWMLKMNPLTAGGPFDLTVQSGTKSITLKNILVGDVWICSGQSNMQFDFNSAKAKYASEIASSENKNIRIITIARTYGITPQDDCRSDGWKTTNPKSVMSFSAAGYFFGKELNEKYKVPIGLIATNYGGTPAEAWTSEEGLQSFPQFAEGVKYLHDTAAVNKKMQASRNNVANWHTRTKSDDSGYVNNIEWSLAAYNDQQWLPVTLPALWDNYGYKNTFGVFWFRKEIDVPATLAGKAGVIKLGSVDDEDETFINGVRVGGYANRTRPREHAIPAGVLKAGKNSIAVRVVNWDNAGGFAGDEPMKLEAGGETISLAGAWKYKIGLKLPQRPGTYQPTSVPTALFNSMVHPLIPMAIKGVIWYQGEANADRAAEYTTLFPNMIADWRKQWAQGDFPFIYQQLVNFRSVVSNPSQSDWAELREAQLKSLSTSNTAMSVGIDIGDAQTIHPLNKKDVGHRLALGAEKIAYGEKDIVYAGPLYKSQKKEGNKIILTFTNTGSGLVANDGKALAQFAIAGEDKKFVWATAVIKGNTVEVSVDGITDPVAVRYAWADNPEGCNLYNKEGLPASPFRTDDWPGVTTGKKFVFR